MQARAFQPATWPLLLLLLTTPAAATTVYKSTDEHGVVSFSDVAPSGDRDVEILVIEVSDPQLSETEQERLQALRETTDRMVADRRAREKHRAELRQLAGYSQPVYTNTAPAETTHFVGYSGSRYYRGYRRGHRPWWEHNRPKPRPPIARPPLRPDTPLARTHRAGDYPGSLVRRHYSPRVRQILSR